MATIDVIVPAYNAAQFLSIALDSVLAQDSPEWQVILVDDGSTDATPEIVDRYRSSFGPKLTYIRQNNQGLPAARNAAIRASKAEFLALLDADDVWLPSRVSASLAAFRRNPALGLTFSGVDLIDQNGTVNWTYIEDVQRARDRTVFKIYTSEIHLPCPTVTFRRSAVEKVGLFDETFKSTEDRDLWLRIAQNYQIEVIPEVLAQYRRSPNSMSMNFQRMFDAQMRFINKHYGTPHCGAIARQIAISRAYRRLAEACRERTLRSAALRNSAKATLMWPFSDETVRVAGACLLDVLRTGAA